MEKTKLSISVDSTADLTNELYLKFNIQVVPLGLVIGDKQYNDGIDVTPNDIYHSVDKLGIMPKSNAALEADYAELFKKGTAGGGCHIHFSISAKLSASHDNAVRAASNFKNAVVIDSKVLSSGTGLLAIMAREMDRAGTAFAEIVQKMQETVNKLQVSFVVDTLHYLHKGGRVSGLKLLGANLLKIHPQLIMDHDGYLVQGKKFSGSMPKVVKEYTEYIINSHPNANKDIVFVTHTLIDPAIAKQMEDDLRAAGFKRIFNTTAGSVITCHCGRGTIGILFAEK